MGSLGEEVTNGYLYKHSHNPPYLKVDSASGLYLNLANGQRILDATGGAAVSAIGHGNTRVKRVIAAQLDEVEYCHPGFFKTACAEQLADFLVDSTSGKMARACILGSGSEAMEAAMKLARQYFLESDPHSPRHRFIAREGSWHGSTIATLALGDFKVRKYPFEPLLADNVSRVSACHPYRGLISGESAELYVARLAQELDEEFQRVGPETVCGFIVEPMVGTALGCVNAVPGYFQAIKTVCERYGALLMFDEIMCGMGRTGTLHAWEQEGVVPDLQAIGKTLASGYAPISALLVSNRVIDTLKEGSGYFPHGQTFQSLPPSCVAALEVQNIIKERGLVANVARMGLYLENLLRNRLGNHPYVGDIRGRGLFWAIEFVADKTTKEPLNAELEVAKRMGSKGLQKGYDISLFAATGAADGWNGDHFLLAPPFTVAERDVEEIVERVCKVIDSVFEDLDAEGKFSKVGGPQKWDIEPKKFL